MSWSFTIPATRVSEFGARLDELAQAQRAQVDTWGSNENEKEATKEQISSAVNAAKSLVGSGVLGGFDAFVGGSLSGHTNPNHGVRDGYSNPMVYLNLSQQAEPPPPAPEEPTAPTTTKGLPEAGRPVSEAEVAQALGQSPPAATSGAAV